MFQIGFHPVYPVWYRLFNFTMAVGLILFALPLFIVISIFLFVTQGRDIFYMGPRLGQDRRTFQIFKFRTLCARRAKRLTRDCTLPRDADIKTPLGGILRDTRLDELPQLFNILKGDMNICGPRPVRPEIARIEESRIPHYGRRFSVKPGLVGPTQAYFGHGTSKRVRARMNNRLVKRPVSIPGELALLVRIGVSVLAKIAGEICRVATGTTPARRRDMWLATQSGDRVCAVESIGMRRVTARGLSGYQEGEAAILYVRLRSGALRKARILISPSATFGVFSYTAETEYGEFIIERYALGLVVLPPRLGLVSVAQDKQRELEQACA